MGLQINQYPIERTALGADDFLDIDYWDGTQYRSAKIKGSNVGGSAPYLAFEFQNDLGVTIPKGTIVYLRTSSTSANYPHVELANSSTEMTSSKTIGAIYDDVANGAIGLIVQVGEVDNLDTSAYNVGDRLWLDNVNGQVTTTIPQTPEHAVFIGIVTRSQNGNGRIVYNIQNGYEVEELHNVLDVDYTTPQDEDSFLIFDETSQIWKKITLLNSTLYGKQFYDNLYQEQLISGTNIKTINGASVLGSGDLVVGGGSALPLALEYNDSNRTIWSNGRGDIVNNTSFGEFSLDSMSTGQYNTAFGAYSLATNQIRSENTAFGYSTLRFGLNPQQNAAFGAYALQSSTGVGNVGVGMWAGIGLTSGNYNTLIGKFCGRTMQGVSNITGVGSNALENNTTGTSLTAVGYYALKANTTGADNTSLGYASLIQSTTGSHNTSIGSNSMYSNINGYQNCALGSNALYNITSGYNNVGIGWGSTPNLGTTTDSIGVGYWAKSNTGSVVIGSNASSTAGTHCVVLGRGASATSDNQFVVGSSSYNAGSVTTESNSSTKVWNVIINGVAQKILLA